MLNPINSLAARTAGAMILNSPQGEGVRNYVVDLYNFLNVTMDEPQFYGRFHLAALCIILLTTVFLAVVMKNAKDKTLRKILALFWVAMVVTELVDQFVCGTSVTEDGLLAYSYRWHTFPFQLCATGIWVLPFTVMLRDCKLRDATLVYMGLFSFFGGLLVCIFPVTVFTDTLVTNIHTMVQHGSQVAVGIFILVNKRDKLNAENFIRACVVFASLVLVATLMNDIMYNVLAAYGIDQEFNMFYISPHYNSGMPVLGIVYDLVPWGAYMLLYILGFITIALAIYVIAKRSIRTSETNDNDDVPKANGHSGGRTEQGRTAHRSAEQVRQEGKGAPTRRGVRGNVPRRK